MRKLHQMGQMTPPDSIVSQGVTESEGDNAHTDMVVSQATKNEILPEVPDPSRRFQFLQKTAENGVQDLSEMPRTESL
ncbi:hypothetical protein MTO96_033205 [Rhipicephalus appendiculatus]